MSMFVSHCTNIQSVVFIHQLVFAIYNKIYGVYGVLVTDL